MSEQYSAGGRAEFTGRKVLELLAELNRTPTGSIIYQHIEQLIGDLGQNQAEVERAYASFLNLLLEACAAQLPDESPLQTHLLLLRMRLTPPLSATEIGGLTRSLEQAADAMIQSAQFDAQRFETALAPLVNSFSPAAREHKTAAPFAAVANGPRKTSAAQSAPPIRPVYPPEDDEPDFAIDDNQRPVEPATQKNAYRAHLDEKRKEMDKLQEDFIRHMKDAVAQSEEFSAHLGIELGALAEAQNLDEIEQRRAAVVESLQALLNGHRVLAEKFENAEQILSFIETDHQKLSNELDRVRLLSLTDELTGLPNRRAFMRRLEDEVSRVQRYGYPMSLVLLDLDHFKFINDQYGHAAGDAVLKIYADKILSIFRHHDMVSRYGGEEFAVLLPNTDAQGVVAALIKVQKRVRDTGCKINEHDVPAPTFSAGVAEYKPGETPGHLIERADAALYRAKHLGRNRIEVYAASGGDNALGIPAKA
jgi:diguanylate cyclase (GGDEF)-like protein